MSYPLMISLIIEHMIGLTDAVFLGRVGDVALGACALGGVYYMAMFMLAFGFGFGAQIIIARRNGERRYNRIAPTMVQGCYFMLVLAVALFAASQYFPPSSCGTSLNPHRCTGPRRITCTGAPTVSFSLSSASCSEPITWGLPRRRF